MRVNFWDLPPDLREHYFNERERSIRPFIRWSIDKHNNIYVLRGRVTNMWTQKSIVGSEAFTKREIEELVMDTNSYLRIKRGVIVKNIVREELKRYPLNLCMEKGRVTIEREKQ